MRLLSALFVFLFVSTTLFSQECQHKKRGHRNPFVRSFADASRSDSLDIQHMTLFLDMTHWSEQELVGIATIEMEAKLDNIERVLLDLLSLQVDSILMDGASLAFTHENALVTSYLPESIDEGTSISLEVYYQGEPPMDDSGWGGFYWQNNHAFNLGVGFDADPHNYGRAWFPCFDNFVERNPYTIEVLTSDNRTAYCGGVRTSIEEVGTDSLLTIWDLEEEIPSYLASIAVGNYTHVEQEFNSITGQTIPIWLTAEQGDTSNVTTSFQNLVPCLDKFETSFGPYLWPRVGYVMVPFSSGAMEHTTNIAYPEFAANGGLSNQTLMAHELAHHWWGDLVTCSSQEDMWINEGMASYCEALFIEGIEGDEAYAEYVRENHKDVLLNAHIRDGARLPVSGIGHENTYGDHVYNKGADVAHTMRGYMGSDFFPVLTSFLDANPYEDVSSEDLRDFIDASTSVDIVSYFDDWIFQPGFPDVRLSSMTVTELDGNWNVEVILSEHLHYADHYYTNVPVQLEFSGAWWSNETQTEDVLVSGTSTTYNFTLPFAPERCIINRNEAINQAVLAEELVIDNDGIKALLFAEFRVDVEVEPVDDSLWIRVENHWTRADFTESQPGIHLADDRFWRIHASGDLAPYQIEGRIRYYGNESANSYFDPLFFEALNSEGLTEENLVLFHRSGPLEPWEELTLAELNIQGQETNWQGFFDFPLTATGDYAWGYYSDVVTVHENESSDLFTVYPNPSSNQIRIKNLADGTVYSVYSLNGRKVMEAAYNGGIDIESLAQGAYSVVIHNDIRTTVSFVKE